MESKIETLKLNTDYETDESHLISSGCNSQLGDDGGHRLVTFNLDNNQLRIYEAVSGTHRYPPGRMMGVSLSLQEFEAMITIYQARKIRQEEELAAQKKALFTASAFPEKDFDPFLDSDDLP